MNKEFTYEVKKEIGVISEGKATKRLRLVSWNGGAEKYDIRGWYIDEDRNEKPNKGITLTEDELKKLASAIKEALA